MRWHGLLVMAAWGATAQTPTFRADANLALVRFQVNLKNGDPVMNLKREDVQLLEDGVPQKIVLWEGGNRTRTVPVEITLLFDCSGSVRFAGLLNPKVFRDSLLDDHKNINLGIAAFSEDWRKLTDPTRDPSVLRDAAQEVLNFRSGTTALYESMAETLKDMEARPANGVKMLVVLSDGEQTEGDELHRFEVIRVSQRAGISIFPVLISGPGLTYRTDSNRALSSALRKGKATYNQAEYLSLADETGGRSFPARGDDVVGDTLEWIRKQNRLDYVAGFEPVPSEKPSFHKVKVVLTKPSRGEVIGGVRLLRH